MEARMDKSKGLLLLCMFMGFVCTSGLLYVFEQFEGGKCEFFTDDLNKTGISYTECLDHCKTRATCTAINFRPMGSFCAMNFNTSTLGPQNCPGYVYSKKSDWTQTSCACPSGQQCDAIGGCNITECSPPVHPPNGKLFGNIFSVGYKVAYRCNGGYSMVTGTSQSTCRTGVGWSGVVPVCYRADTCSDDLVTGPNGVADSQLTATSNWCQNKTTCIPTDGFSAKYARINSTGGLTGAWVSLVYDLNQYIQIDFVEMKVVVGIKMLGRHNNIAHVTSFQLSHSSDCITFLDYLVAGVVQSFNANSQSAVPVSIHLPVPVVARCIRINPQTWSSE